MNIRKISLILILIFINLISCTHKTPEFSDFGKQLLMTQGEDFILKIPANHSSGYEWFEKTAIDTNLLKLKFIDYHVAKKREAGVAGFEYWHFNAKQAGETSIQLYHRQGLHSENSDSLNIHIKITD